MIRYYVVEPSAQESKVDEVKDTYWFTNPIKKEGYRHNCMIEVHQIDHWSKKSMSYSDTCYLEVYTYGDMKPITINGWKFQPSGIKANYAQTPRFCGMEMWFKCVTPEGKEIEWYKNDGHSASPHSVIKAYFNEINRISQYRTEEEAEKHTYNDPYLHVRR